MIWALLGQIQDRACSNGWRACTSSTTSLAAFPPFCRPGPRVQSSCLEPYMQKAGDSWDISPQIFLDFRQNFRLRTRNQYCTQAIAWGSTILDGGSTILDGGSTILDGSSTIFCRFSPFFIDFHDLRTFVAIYILSRFTHFFRKFFLAKIAFSTTSHVFCMYGDSIIQKQSDSP